MEKQKLPHSQGALILGITSILMSCCCYGIPIGLILGAIGMMQAKRAKAIHDENPEMYDGIKNAETGKITSIIGVVIGAIGLLYMIYIVSTGQWGDSMEQFKEMMEQIEQNQ